MTLKSKSKAAGHMYQKSKIRKENHVSERKQLNIHDFGNGDEVKISYKQSYICFKCKRVYVHNTSLNRHLKWECGKEPLFTCRFCSFRTKHKNALKTHLRKQHEMGNVPK